MRRAKENPGDAVCFLAELFHIVASEDGEVNGDNARRSPLISSTKLRAYTGSWRGSSVTGVILTFAVPAKSFPVTPYALLGK
jgi:hypothetical protein